MRSLFFWKEWSQTYRLPYLNSLFFLSLSLLLFGAAWYRGVANVVQWDVLSELIDLPTTIRTLTDGLFDYNVPGKAYAVSEQFVASVMQVHPWMATVLLGALLIGFAGVLSAATRLSRIPFLGMMTAFILVLAVCRFETLEIPGLDGQYVFGILAFVLGSVAYYFHAFRADIPMPARFGVFGLLLIGLTLGLGALSPVPHPALTVVSYGMPAFMLVSVGFILFIAFEIIAGLVWITSANLAPTVGQSGGSATRRTFGLRNFVLLTSLYLVNLMLVWLQNTKTLELDWLTVSPFLIYLTSLLLGIWGYRRQVEQQEAVPFAESGAFLYVGLGLVTTATMTYAFATANDPIVEMFEDAIVYSHLAMGTAFVLYVLYNFRQLFAKGLAVHRVLYKPKQAGLTVFRLGGLVVFGALLGGANLFPVRQAITGYYNGLGDLYMASGQLTSAQAFYQLGAEQEFQNHKSNYALASLALRNNEPGKAAYFFNQALLKQPSPQAFAALSSTYQQTNLFFEAIKALQRGLSQFPKSGELQNNLGYLYSRTSIADSAYYYFQTAVANTSRTEVPEANLLGLYARNPQVLATDSTLARQTDRYEYESYQANALAIRLVARPDTAGLAPPTWLAAEPPVADSLLLTEGPAGLSVGRFASLYNYALVSPRPDSLLLKTLQQRGRQVSNQDFADDLLLAQAMVAYRSGRPADTFTLLSQLADGSPRTAESYRTALGLLLMDSGLYPKANQMLELNTDTLSMYYRALTLTKMGDLVAAQSLWETAGRNDAGVAGLKQILYQERPPVSDLEKAFYVSYRTDDPNRGRYWETIRDADLKTVSGATLIEEYLATRQPFYAQMILSQMGKPAQLSPFALSLENLSALRITVFRNKLPAADSMSRGFFALPHRAERQFLLGTVLARNKKMPEADRAFAEALRLAPLDAQIATGAARFWQQQKQTDRAYRAVVGVLDYNAREPELWKTYISLCLEQRLTDYAEDALPQLQSATSPADYQAFLADYQQKLTSIEKQRQTF
ncbi:hypothetical protein F5984_08555 [Rudanella paleaurantiibacter]|uniref:Tetratricopeptide repeat protein n=1 Tax=Rudanella paleaurantiibacter TaxID=2614655 RepID=A0A7J5U3H1_9BACT|nr:hypothetical protein [Rudanella paleaurantiibacter]KAB7732241.1 hypothetical protein F5984_08555 [Rudanella paleaurantiibacter]